MVLAVSQLSPAGEGAGEGAESTDNRELAPITIISNYNQAFFSFRRSFRGRGRVNMETENFTQRRKERKGSKCFFP